MTTRIYKDGIPVVLEGTYRPGLYAKIFLDTFANIIEGYCPNCHYKLRQSSGYCWECCCNWSATEEPRSEGVRRIIQCLDGPEYVLTWTLAPGIGSLG